MICTWCSRCWRSPIILPSSSGALRTDSILPLPARKAAGWRIATRERIALAVAIGFPAVAATHGRSSVTWTSVMKVLLTALALVTLIASPTFAQRQYPGEFYPTSYQSPASTQSAPAARKAGRDACQSGQHEYCDYPGGPVWH